MAKLRLHTEETLTILDNVTRSLGISLRAFKKDTCTKYQTNELPREAAARQRRQTSAARKRKGKKVEVVTEQAITERSQPSRRRKGLNLNTYKLHSLGDYVDAIRQYGTTDSYSTQLVSRTSLCLENDWRFSRVNYHIVIPRFPIRGLAKKITRGRLPRLRGDERGFAASGRKSQINQHRCPRPMNTSRHVLTIIMRSESPRIIRKTFCYFCSKTPMILLLK